MKTRQTLIALVALTGALAIGFGVRRQMSAQMTFPGYTATYFDYHNCDPQAAANCPPQMQYQEEMFPDGERRLTTNLVQVRQAPPVVQIGTLTHNIMAFPAVGSYYQLPRRKEELAALRVHVNANCDPKDGSVPDRSVVLFLGHPAVKYDNASRGQSITYLTDAACFGARKVFGWGGGAATYQIASTILIGTPAASDLQVPPGLIEKSPTEAYHDQNILLQTRAGVPDPEQLWQKQMQGAQGSMMTKLTKSWQAHQGQ